MNIHQCYELKPSRFALGFQLFFLIVIFVLLLSQLNIGWCALLLLMALVALKVMRGQANVQCLEYLDQQDWTLKFNHSPSIQHVKIKQMFDHSFYIVIHFQEKNVKNLIIWHDQLSRKQWKSMKIRSKLI